MKYEVDDVLLLSQQESGGVLYSKEGDDGVHLWLHREGHYLHAFKERPPMTYIDENGVELPDTTFIVWKSEKLNRAIPVQDAIDTSENKSKSYVLQEVALARHI